MGKRVPPEARKHHFVPRSVLRNFVPLHGRRQVFAFDKKSGKQFRVSIQDAAAERDFNRVVIGKWDLSYEVLFQELDHRLASVIGSLMRTETLREMGQDILGDLPRLLACQLVRTKMARTSPVELSIHLSEWMESLGLGPTQLMDDTDARRVALGLLFDLDKLAEGLKNKIPVILISESANLWISDNPVVMHNTFPYGRVGLAAPGIEIYYPISPNRCLALYCPSVSEILSEATNDAHPRPAPSDPFLYDLHQSFQDGRPLAIDENYCRFLNELQVSRSSRFLYASDDDFALAREVLSHRPQAREVRSLHGMSSSIVPPVPDLAEGDWLILEKGHRHHCLSIEWLCENSPFIDSKQPIWASLLTFARSSHLTLPWFTEVVTGGKD